jgi:predicted protein tyrosine phosphatase
MYVEPLHCQMAVCSFDGAARLVGFDQGYWNVVSINGPREQKAHLRLAKSVHYSCFDDVENPVSEIYRPPRDADLEGIFAFVRSLGVGPPAPPLLIHCQMGISRSTAVALAWIYGHLPPSNSRLEEAVDLILELQPLAKPNRLVLALGLAQFFPADEAHQLAAQVVSEPRLAQNRFQRPLER